MSDTISSKIQSKERELPALRYTSPLVMAFMALLGINVENGFTSVPTRICQSLWPYIKDGIAKLMGEKGTPGATARFQGWLGTRECNLDTAEREAGLQALLIAKAMPTERQFMGAYMLSGLSAAELNSACVLAFGAQEGKAYASLVRSVAKFLGACTTLVEADVKKKSGTTAHLGARASDGLAAAREAQAANMLAMMTKPKSE